MSDMGQAYDCIIVGGGTAGCVLANRLSANPKRRILLLEAGPEDRNIWLKIPAGVARVVNNPKLSWRYMSDPEKGLNGRRIIWPRGRVMGGSSSINGHVYMRGVSSDYDGWRDAGNPGWGWADVLPLFKRGERHFAGESDWHGGNGEMAVSALDEAHPSSEAFIAAAQALGVPYNPDFNGAQQEGVGTLQFMIDRGTRASAAAAFLRPIRNRPNLRVISKAHACRIVIDGKVAKGVVYRSKGLDHTVFAREVILSGGAINSPQLLMLSGIGPAETLRDLGLNVVHANSAVGRNLQDHIYAHYLAAVRPALSLNHTIGSAIRMAPHVLRYAITRRGLLTSAAAQVGLFARSDPASDQADLQIQMRPFSMLSSGGMYTADRDAAVTASCTLLRPHSRGAVELRSADPEQAPGMHAGYLTDERDVAPMIAGLRLIRRIFSQAPLAEGVIKEILPGSAAESDADLLAYLRGNAQAMYHPVGSCRMGAGADAVVDARLRVHGIKGLRIIDASIMPTIPSGNTNAPTAMIAENGAQMLIEDENRA